MSSKIKTIFECQNCGAQFPKWSGRCLECGSWGTLSESLSDDKKNNEKSVIDKIASAEVVNLENISGLLSDRFKTGVSELDRVLGGGLIQGSLILLSGEPGVGKSTLLAQISDSIVKNNKNFSKVLYVSGEESAGQVKLRLERLKCNLKYFDFVSETNLEKIIATAIKNKPDLLIADSIQTIYSALLPSEAGGVSQIRAIAVKFMELAKKYNIPVFLIGHITKDGQVAGPKSLEHIVDVVLSLENDGRGSYSILRSSKNRFGSVNEVGVLEMTSFGFEEVKNTSSVFLDNDLSHSFPGSSFSCVVEGNRPFLINVQALVSRTVFGYPQRKSSGFDLNRLQVLSMVISKKQKLDLMNQDIILNIVGGLRASDPALDLAVCLSITSSFLNQEILGKTAVLGELGLGGELRPVSYLDMRLREIEKMGFTDVLLPNSLSESEKERMKGNFKKLKFIFSRNLSEAIKNIFNIKEK
jgi:DNA repair protein RadA/Sms